MIYRGGRPRNKNAIRETREQGEPTSERVKHSEGHFHIGDDKQGGKIYQFCDAPLDRLYARFAKAAASDADRDLLRKEYTALQKLKHHWYRAGKELTIGSVDPNSIFSSDPSRRSGMPMAEANIHHNQQFRAARCVLPHDVGLVVENVVLNERTLEIAGYAIGYTSALRARQAAEKLIRKGGERLSDYWGVG